MLFSLRSRIIPRHAPFNNRAQCACWGSERRLDNDSPAGLVAFQCQQAEFIASSLASNHVGYRMRVQNVTKQGGCDKVTRLRNDHMITPTYYACIVYGRRYAWNVNSLAVTTRRSNFSSQFWHRIKARLTGLRYAYS